MINTFPGAELTVITWIETVTDGCFNDHGPLGGVVLGTSKTEFRGVLVEAKDDIMRVMKIDRTGDFSAMITIIDQKSVLYLDSATINKKHELEMSETRRMNNAK